MTMSLSTGLISGMDTGSLITQLIQAEAAPQMALKTRLKSTELAASAYRTVNAAFLAISEAAAAAHKPATWTTTKGTSSSTGVAVTAGANATTGSLTFTVEKLAAAHGVFKQDPAWTTSTSAAGFSSLDVYAADGTTKKGTITIGGTQTLADAAAAINASSYGLSATVVQTGTNAYALQVNAKKTGADSAFSLQGGGTFTTNSQGQNAEVKVGTTGGYTVSSDTNTFTSLMAGTTITVSKVETTTPVTVGVAQDPEAVADKMSALVDAINAALDTVKKQTSNAPGSNAALRGEYPVTSLAGRLLDAVSGAVGPETTPPTAGTSPAVVGVQLTKDGKVTFDRAKFLTALKETPELANRVVAGDAAAAPAVKGITDRLLEVTKLASDSTKGTLVSLAQGQDAMARDLKTRIDSWDLRLAKRKEVLSRQFTAMETALSSLRNQSTWLAGQINSLPS
jgi:flagellar hook-associated protein 2